MNKNLSLPTLYYPFVERNNWRYWYKLSNGEYIVKDFQTMTQCVKMLRYCIRCGIEYKACPRRNFLVGTEFAFLLNLFYNRITDRKPQTQEKSGIFK